MVANSFYYHHARLIELLFDGSPITEGILNRIEAGIRMFDPCLSCSTRADGRMALHVRILNPHGSLRTEIPR